MKYIVVDLDNTLCDDSHRQEFATNGDWDNYHLGHIADEPYQDVLSVLKSTNNRVLIITCRPERYRQTTEEWLRKHDIQYYFLLMRLDTDYRPSEELKVKLLEYWFDGKRAVLDNVLFILEDRDKIVKAFRDYGLICWQVRDGAY